MLDFYLVIELWEVSSTECYNGNEQQQQANMKTPLKIAHPHLVQTTWHAIPSLHPTKQDGGSLIIYATPLIGIQSQLPTKGAPWLTLRKKPLLTMLAVIWWHPWCASPGSTLASPSSGDASYHLLASCFVLALLLRRPLFAQIFRLTGPPKTIPTLSQS